MTRIKQTIKKPKCPFTYIKYVSLQENLIERGTEVPDEASIAESLPEQDILIQSVCETMVPKLVAEDIPLLFSLLNDVFPNVGYTRAEMTGRSLV